VPNNLAENDGVYGRSRGYAYTLSQNINVDTNFLDQFMGWDCPEIAEILLVFSGSVTAGGGGAALGRDAAKAFFDNVDIRMSGGQIVNAGGATLRVNEQAEYGDKQLDPADVTAAGTNAAYEYQLAMPFEFPKSGDEYKRDCRLSLKAFKALGGQITIRTPAALPTNWSTCSGTVEVYCRVVEARNRQANSFYTLLEYNVTQIEDYYPIEGSARAISLTSRRTDTGYTSLTATTYNSFDSRTLGWEAGLHPRVLRDRYRHLHLAVGTNDEHILVPVALAGPAFGAIPIVNADKDQRIVRMPMLSRLHLDLNAAAPANGVLMVGAIKDRAPVYSAYAMGYQDVNQYLADVLAMGVVRDGKDTKCAEFDPYLVNRMPVRIKPAA
jgi:hypothetical protein